MEKNTENPFFEFRYWETLSITIILDGVKDLKKE